ncbi:PepSY-associated TM helix domain-containing protein [Cyclobacterium marinum]|uniref:PepSY-associated TM helix domain-containing protein n=1 Tax=Cyclobacterium marinum TaxID=104 RepID=UPI0030D926D4|tara:strand:- start:108973 stop:110094 length:1122 start_codon:yes stop_codon:yes gene_type:complete
MRFKKIVRKIHLWLGLGSGIIVFLVSFSGCLYVFQEEISLFLQSGVFRNVEVQDRELISPIQVRTIIEKEFAHEIAEMNVTAYESGDRASIVWVRDTNRQYTAFLLNPYTGEVIDTYPYSITFWAIVLVLHTSLLIPGIGHHIVAAGTLTFVILMISGIFLWFPKSKNGYKQRFSIKWGASFKRLNYDLHNVLGFYMTWVSIFLAITGLIWSYAWVDQGIYWLASGGKQIPKQEQLFSKIPITKTHSSQMINAVLVKLIKERDEKLHSYYIEYPSDSLSLYKIKLHYDKGSFYNRHDTYQIDQYNGEIKDAELWKNKNAGDVIQAANFNAHVGSILGLPGKFLAFFASLIASSLPVSGFLIWRGRKRKNKTIV